MKILYPTKPVADYYLEGFSYYPASGTGYAWWEDLAPGWNTLQVIDFTDVKGFLKILNLQVIYGDGVSGLEMGVRFRINDGANFYTIYYALWLYGQMPLRWAMNITPDLPIALGSSGYIEVWYTSGALSYNVAAYLLFAQYA